MCQENSYREKDQADYREDRLLKQTVGRNFEIAGEAIGRLSREAPDTASRIGEYERIVAFRNVLIHDYDLVDDALVWDTIQEKVPRLVSEVELLLEEYEHGE